MAVRSLEKDMLFVVRDFFEAGDRCARSCNRGTRGGGKVLDLRSCLAVVVAHVDVLIRTAIEHILLKVGGIFEARQSGLSLSGSREQEEKSKRKRAGEEEVLGDTRRQGLKFRKPL